MEGYWVLPRYQAHHCNKKQDTVVTYSQEDACLIKDGPHFLHQVSLHILPSFHACIIVWITLSAKLVNRYMVVFSATYNIRGFCEYLFCCCVCPLIHVLLKQITVWVHCAWRSLLIHMSHRILHIIRWSSLLHMFQGVVPILTVEHPV